jgi:hypothetical protein
VAAVCVVVPGADVKDDVNAVDVIGCDRCWRLCNPNRFCCCCRLRCKADDDEEPPTSAVLPKEDTTPIAANRNTNMVPVAIGKYIGLPLHSSFMVMDSVLLVEENEVLEFLSGRRL